MTEPCGKATSGKLRLTGGATCQKCGTRRYFIDSKMVEMRPFLYVAEPLPDGWHVLDICQDRGVVWCPACIAKALKEATPCAACVWLSRYSSGIWDSNMAYRRSGKSPEPDDAWCLAFYISIANPEKPRLLYSSRNQPYPCAALELKEK